MKRPVKLGGEENPKVTDGLGDRDMVGCDRTQREKNGGGRGAEQTGRKVGGMEEHEFCLIKVDGEAGKGEPGADMVPGVRDLSGGGEEGGAGSVDAAIVNVECEVFSILEGGSMKEWRGWGRGVIPEGFLSRPRRAPMSSH